MRRVVRLYGPTGDAPGWRLWIDAWALAQREPEIRTVLRHLDRRWDAVVDLTSQPGRVRRALRGAGSARLSASVAAGVDDHAVPRAQPGPGRASPNPS